MPPGAGARWRLALMLTPLLLVMGGALPGGAGGLGQHLL